MNEIVAEYGPYKKSFPLVDNFYEVQRSNQCREDWKSEEESQIATDSWHKIGKIVNVTFDAFFKNQRRIQ